MFDWLLAIALSTAHPSSAPSPGSMAFGSPERTVTAVLGKPCRSWTDHGFTWRRYQRGSTCVDAGFYRDKLGRLRIRPARPIDWVEALNWAEAAVPSLEHATKRHESPEARDYFQQITLDGVPFEVGTHFHMKAGRVTEIDGEMNWLD